MLRDRLSVKNHGDEDQHCTEINPKIIEYTAVDLAETFPVGNVKRHCSTLLLIKNIKNGDSSPVIYLTSSIGHQV